MKTNTDPKPVLGRKKPLPQGANRSSSATIGEAAALSPETVAALTLVTPVDALTSLTVQGYFAGVLAASLGCLLVWAAGPRRVRLAAVASAD